MILSAKDCVHLPLLDEQSHRFGFSQNYPFPHRLDELLTLSQGHRVT